VARKEIHVVNICLMIFERNHRAARRVYSCICFRVSAWQRNRVRPRFSAQNSALSTASRNILLYATRSRACSHNKSIAPRSWRWWWWHWPTKRICLRSRRCNK
jgi:hypothetical protein